MLSLRINTKSLIILLFAAISFVAASNAIANQALITSVNPVVRDEKLYLDTDIELTVKGELRNVAMKGVPIYFTANTDIRVKRWWWFDKVIAEEQITWRIMYNALTRQWNVSTGLLSVPEATFDDALKKIKHIRSWPVADVSRFSADKTYYGRIRLRLDTSLLARPFQIDALNSSAWSLATPWKDFSFSILKNEPQP